MAHNNSPDSEFDPEMERVLREHFDAQDSSLRAPNDPWPWLESRMEEPAMPTFFSRLLGYLNPMRGGRLSPAFAVAGVAVVAVAMATVVWVASGGGPESSGELALVPATEAPPGEGTALQFAELRLEPTTQVAQEDTAPAGPAGPSGPAGASGAAGAASPAGPQGQAGSVPPSYTTATPAPTPTMQAQAFAEPAPRAMAPTQAPQSTPAPSSVTAQEQEALRVMAPTPAPAAAADSAGPRGPSGSSGTAGPGGTPPGTTFRDYQRQPFVSAAQDNLSTFSLDTDRTSLHLALNWARAGYEVNPDSVRAEEWLNAFNYEYAQPSGTDNFAITSNMFPHPLDESKRLARIAFQAPELVDDRPLNVTLVLDASGSMGDGNRVNIARQAAESIRRSLRDDDRIAVVHFTDDVIDSYTVEHRSPDHYRVIDSISWLEPHGSTNVQAGLNLGVRLASDARDRRPDTYNYVILMSDGVANVDATDPFAILETAYDPDTRNPLRLITIGVGINNYNDPLLEQLAQHGNGWYRYLDSTEQAEATFTRDNWLALSIPFADQTRAQVTWNTGTVEQWRIIGYENRVTADENFTQDRKEFAELYSGATTTVLYELELTEAARSLTSVPLGQVELRWVEPDTGDSRSQTANLSGNAGAGFEGYHGSLARFGAIVALAADLYGSLPNYPENTYPEIHSGLSSLQAQLEALSDDLGSLDAYNDFVFLLDHIASSVGDRMPSSARSGYSR